MHEHTLDRPAHPALGAGLAAGGAMLIGAVVGMQADMQPGIQLGFLARTATLLPLVLIGVSAAMIPALYIAMSLAGAAPPARRVAMAHLRALGACGVVLCGLAGPLAFLLATSQSAGLAMLLGAAVVATGALAGLRVLFHDLFSARGRALAARFVFALWSLVSLAIGARMYIQLMAG